MNRRAASVAMLTRRAFCIGLAGAGLAAPALAQSAFPKAVTDIAGRVVTLPKAPARILLADGVQFLSLALVDPKIASRLALIGDDAKRFDPGTSAALAALYPGLAGVPTIADLGDGAMEQALVARPDLVILSLWQKDEAASAMAQFSAMDIPVIFTDFFVDPLRNTGASMRLLGDVLGQPERGVAYANFHAEHLARVASGIATAAGARPSILLQAYPGLWACCWSAGRMGFGDFITLAGGRNIGAGQFPSALGGTLSLEFVLAAKPDIYIGTGLSKAQTQEGLTIGPGVAESIARASLRRVMAESDLATIPAIQNGAGYALWNYFNGSPLNILAIEAMAGWFHPKAAAAAGISAETCFAEICDRFLRADLAGALWIAA